jgi:hypothetical protein
MKKIKTIFRQVKNSASRQQGFLNSRQAFVLLALLFMAPAFVSWIMHNSTESGWRPEGTTNQGNLVHPARPLIIPSHLLVGDIPLNEFIKDKWTLLYIGDADCDEICRENLYKMRQIRIAQNENMNRVQRLFILKTGNIPEHLAGFLGQEHPKMAVATVNAEQLAEISTFFEIDATPVISAGRVYFVDPLGNLMMYYEPDAAAGGMLKDLKKLLKYSRIG